MAASAPLAWTEPWAKWAKRGAAVWVWGWVIGTLMPVVQQVVLPAWSHSQVDKTTSSCSCHTARLTAPLATTSAPNDSSPKTPTDGRD
jgi:hypothetical protein